MSARAPQHTARSIDIDIDVYSATDIDIDIDIDIDTDTSLSPLASHTVVHNPFESWHALTHISARPSIFTPQLASLKRTGPGPQ